MEKYRVLEKRFLTPHCFVLRTEKRSLAVKAGQCVNLGPVGGGVNREYSLYCGENDPYLEFLIKEIENGLVSRMLAKLQPGDRVEIDGAYGEFTIREEEMSRAMTFIATGTGIAPFKCFTRTFPSLDWRIIHGVRAAEEQYEKSTYPAKRYVGCLSHEDGGDYQGRVTDFLENHPGEIDSSRVYYLCGNRKMISDVYDLLVDYGVNGSSIRTEVFF